MKFLVSLVAYSKGQTIVDPFIGTGSTGCVCKLLNRNFVCIEIDPNYNKTLLIVEFI